MPHKIIVTFNMVAPRNTRRIYSPCSLGAWEKHYRARARAKSKTGVSTVCMGTPSAMRRSIACNTSSSI